MASSSPSTSSILVPAALLLAVAAAGSAAWFVLRGDDATPGHGGRPPVALPGPGQKGHDPVTPPLRAEKIAPAPVPVKSPQNISAVFQAPDGTYLPSLNRVLNAPAMQWPAHRPYSPVVGTTRNEKGVEFYMHQDGSLSTTVMQWRADLGREDATTLIFNPEKPMPMQQDPAKN